MKSRGERPFTLTSPRTGGRYRRLFQVEFTHSFYVRTGGKCPDFRTVPTDATAKVMASLGLVMNDEGSGFSVFFQENGLENILSYIRREARDQSGAHGFWSRLTFLLELTGADFIGITALPIQTRQCEQNLFGSNLVAHYPDTGDDTADDSPAILSAGPFMDETALRHTIGAGVSLVVPASTSSVIVRDISGAPVLVWPTPDEEAEMQDEAVDKAASEAAGDTPPLPRQPQRIAFDFSGLPNDLYSLTAYDQAGVVQPKYSREVLFVPPELGALVLLDMLFTKPTPDSEGIYPIPPLFAPLPDGPCGDVRYTLPFDARHTFWRYYVAPHVRGAKLDALAIVGRGTTFQPAPDPVKLPDGSLATLFTADTPIPLRQQSAERFALSGVRRDPSGRENAIRVVPLPVAPPAPVWPASAGDETGTSEMFVYV